MKNLTKLLLIITLIGVIYLVFLLYSIAFGSPFQKYNFKKDLIQYLEKNYPDKKTKILEVKYNFKLSNGEKDYLEAYFYFLNDKSRKSYKVYTDLKSDELTDNL